MSRTIVVKLGGGAFDTPEGSERFAQDLLTVGDGFRIVVVHGGGKEVTDLSRRLGLEPAFVQGLRMTTSKEMDIVDMVLAGLVNKRLVRVFRSQGLPAVGISGSDGNLVAAAPLGPHTEHTGIVESVDPSLLELLLKAGFVPIVAPPSADSHGRRFNINADSVALGLAEALSADTLLFLSDVPGVRLHETTQQTLSIEVIEREIASGAIGGGMIPKLRSCIAALRGGVKHSIIGQYATAGDLHRLLSRELGTRIVQS